MSQIRCGTNRRRAWPSWRWVKQLLGRYDADSAMRKLTLMGSHSSADFDRVHIAHGSPRSARATSESEYVSLAELYGSPPSVAARAARLVGLTSRLDDNADDPLVPLKAAGVQSARRAQDALLATIVVVCVSLVGTAWAQVYSGQLCESVEAAQRCTLLRDSVGRGAPDVAMHGHTFDGGWPLPHSLVHVFVPVVVLLSVVAIRIHASTVHHSLAWLALGLAELSVIIIDTIALRRWRGPICRQFEATIASSLVPQTKARWTGRCDTAKYEAFVAAEMLLVAALVALVLLEPVFLRLWCGVGSCDKLESSETLDTLQHEDAPVLQAAYKRL